jgi:hypothetical protein
MMHAGRLMIAACTTFFCLWGELRAPLAEDTVAFS